MDYTKDERWNTWNQEALKRFLVKTETITTGVARIAEQSLRYEPITEFTRNVIPGSWVKPNEKPNIFWQTPAMAVKPDLFGLEMTFGDEITQMVALEDDAKWDFNSVGQKWIDEVRI